MPEPLDEKTDAAILSGVSWHDLRQTWPTLPTAEKRRMLLFAADALWRAWKNKINIESFPLPLLVFQAGDVLLPEHFVKRRSRPMTQQDLLMTWARWHLELGDVVMLADQLFFLRRFFRHESVDPCVFRHVVSEIGCRVDQLTMEEGRGLYNHYLAEPLEYRHGGSQSIRGIWRPLQALTASALRLAIEEAERHEATKRIKTSSSIRVLRANLFGEDVLIKRYDVRTWKERLKYRLRPSRARRAWAAAHTLKQLNIPTPEPLGVLEIMGRGIPVRSYVVTRYLDHAGSTYRWLKTQYRHQTDVWKNEFSADLLASLLKLYENGIYHGDTKLLNLLIELPENRRERVFYWIDLECVLAGVRPNRYQILRNVVQLNGSVRHWVPEEDRFRFLRELAKVYPWLENPWVIRWIRRWTRRRLVKEVRLHCGP